MPTSQATLNARVAGLQHPVAGIESLLSRQLPKRECQVVFPAAAADDGDGRADAALLQRLQSWLPPCTASQVAFSGWGYTTVRMTGGAGASECAAAFSGLRLPCVVVPGDPSSAAPRTQMPDTSDVETIRVSTAGGESLPADVAAELNLPDCLEGFMRHSSCVVHCGLIPLTANVPAGWSPSLVSSADLQGLHEWLSTAFSTCALLNKTDAGASDMNEGLSMDGTECGSAGAVVCHSYGPFIVTEQLIALVQGAQLQVQDGTVPWAAVALHPYGEAGAFPWKPDTGNSSAPKPRQRHIDNQTSILMLFQDSYILLATGEVRPAV